MRVFSIAIICWSVVLTVSNATPQKYASGILSLDAFLNSKDATTDQIIVGMTGFYGQSQPQQWLILTRNIDPQQGMQEYVVSGKHVQGSRKMQRLPNQDLPTIPIDRKRLKVDSTIAFEIAEDLALHANIGYDSVHYQLRCRDLNHEPVWMVNMLDPIGRSVGIHYISAETGLVLRSVWHRASRHSLTKTSDGKPVDLLYGGKIREITVSGKANPKRRELSRVISPKTP